MDSFGSTNLKVSVLDMFGMELFQSFYVFLIIFLNELFTRALTLDFGLGCRNGLSNQYSNGAFIRKGRAEPSMKNGQGNSKILLQPQSETGEKSISLVRRNSKVSGAGEIVRQIGSTPWLNHH